MFNAQISNAQQEVGNDRTPRSSLAENGVERFILFSARASDMPEKPRSCRCPSIVIQVGRFGDHREIGCTGPCRSLADLLRISSPRMMPSWRHFLEKSKGRVLEARILRFCLMEGHSTVDVVNGNNTDAEGQNVHFDLQRRLANASKGSEGDRASV